ncbi:unnamed protein product [Effrenium voratum]|nr:unnamed protein product [Effrenium voratum]
MAQLCYENTFITVKDAIGSEARARSSPVRTLRRSSPEALYVASLERVIGLTPAPTREPAAVREAEAPAVEDVAASEAEAPEKEAAVSFGIWVTRSSASSRASS